MLVTQVDPFTLQTQVFCCREVSWIISLVSSPLFHYFCFLETFFFFFWERKWIWNSWNGPLLSCAFSYFLYLLLSMSFFFPLGFSFVFSVLLLYKCKKISSLSGHQWKILSFLLPKIPLFLVLFPYLFILFLMLDTSQLCSDSWLFDHHWAHWKLSAWGRACHPWFLLK